MATCDAAFGGAPLGVLARGGKLAILEFGQHFDTLRG
jgi:hypothetical protein